MIVYELYIEGEAEPHDEIDGELDKLGVFELVIKDEYDGLLLNET